ncbi:hypothetical protein A3D78_03750 [Candidatus Gottesmanbacteria bacterium RIFCSPHIGHO2_02_FULL_39_14]|uniref:Uncharacterized protein n=1 Tax=Candidatus Gottesmanbacteria bacterium RIFCSPHIGHO2_02_FULL_39_14 TaxID=1798383 RepID=A0A1F5ZXQ9_9BACT|nr:MAG: hypothetical protein A3D78_03750 [Candidatus Gottesmanbacteria bacterium RIFCSPHIGHO2_02_FULL_39_14]
MDNQKNQLQDWFEIILTRKYGIDLFHREKKHVNPKEMYIWDWRLLFYSLFAIIWLLTTIVGFILAGTFENIKSVYLILMIFPLIIFLQKVKKLKNHWNKENKNTFIYNSKIFIIFIIIFFIFLYFRSY